MRSRSYWNIIIVALVWEILSLGASAETREPVASDAELPA